MKNISLELTDDFFTRFISACQVKIDASKILDAAEDGVYPKITEQDRAEKSAIYLISQFVKSHEINEAKKAAKENITISTDSIKISDAKVMAK